MFFSMYAPNFRDIFSAMSFSLEVLPAVPGSRPPWPGSITMVATREPVARKEAEEFSKVIANRRTFTGIFLTNVSMCDRIEITLHKVVNFSQHDKHSFPLTIGKGFVIRFLIIFACAVFFLRPHSFAQKQNRVTPTSKSQPAKNDTLPKNGKLSVADTSKIKKDSTNTAPKGDIESTIIYSAEDSIISELGKKIVRLYGNA